MTVYYDVIEDHKLLRLTEPLPWEVLLNADAEIFEEETCDLTFSGRCFIFDKWTKTPLDGTFAEQIQFLIKLYQPFLGGPVQEFSSASQDKHTAGGLFTSDLKALVKEFPEPVSSSIPDPISEPDGFRRFLTRAYDKAKFKETFRENFGDKEFPPIRKMSLLWEGLIEDYEKHCKSNQLTSLPLTELRQWATEWLAF